MLATEEIIRVLEKEIVWCLEHPATNLSKDSRRGFVWADLKQAINLIEKMNEK